MRLEAKIVGRGQTSAALRSAVMARAADGPAVPEPYDCLAHQISEEAHRVTDEDVAAVRAAAGSDRGVFEIILAASVGAGLARWDAAARAIDGAEDASG